jgi:hypothetical protein
MLWSTETARYVDDPCIARDLIRMGELGPLFKNCEAYLLTKLRAGDWRRGSPNVRSHEIRKAGERGWMLVARLEVDLIKVAVPMATKPAALPPNYRAEEGWRRASPCPDRLGRGLLDCRIDPDSPVPPYIQAQRSSSFEAAKDAAMFTAFLQAHPPVTIDLQDARRAAFLRAAAEAGWWDKARDRPEAKDGSLSDEELARFHQRK